MKPIQTNTFLSFTEILTQSAALQDFAKKTESLIQLNRAILNNLDPLLAAHCQVLSLNDNRLILAASSPAWGHKLRFISPELLEILRQNPKWAALKAIQVRVQPSSLIETKIEGPILPPPNLSSQGASHVLALAEQVSALRLRQSLLRLSSRYVAVAGYK